MAGALLAGLFRQLFRKLTQNVRKYLQLCLDKGTQFVVGTAIKSQVGGTLLVAVLRFLRRLADGVGSGWVG